MKKVQFTIAKAFLGSSLLSASIILMLAAVVFLQTTLDEK